VVPDLLTPHSSYTFPPGRHVLFTTDALAQDFFRMVSSLFGSSPKQKDQAYRFSMHFLLELSQALGKSDRQQMQNRLEQQCMIIKGEENVVSSCFPITMTLTGWGRVQIVREHTSLNRADFQSFCLVYEIEDSFESHSWLSTSTHQPSPVCIVAAGFPVGWCRADVDFDLSCVEIECRAAGHHRCVFVMSSDAAIEKHVKRILQLRHGAKQLHCLTMLDILKQKRQHGHKGFHARIFS